MNIPQVVLMVFYIEYLVGSENTEAMYHYDDDNVTDLLQKSDVNKLSFIKH